MGSDRLARISFVNAGSPSARVAVLHSDETTFLTLVNPQYDATRFRIANCAIARHRARVTGDSSSAAISSILPTSTIRAPTLEIRVVTPSHSGRILAA